MAGPIERAKNLLPQFYVKREFDYSLAKDGLRQILWGLVKKVIVADNCAIGVDYIFNNSHELNGLELLLGAILFSFQIYGDFSGYSDIAIGSGKLCGIRLSKNFDLPYFSRDIAEFWRRWHISLSTWFRDYVYIPLGGNRTTQFLVIINILITFTISGLWHGANWTFIVWGLINGLLFIPLVLLKTHKNNVGIVAENTFFPSLRELFSIGSTFLLVTLVWIIFRAEDMTHATSYITSLVLNMNQISVFHLGGVIKPIFISCVAILCLVSIEWLQRKKDHGLQINELGTHYRWLTYYALLFLVFYFSKGENSFIYFQF